jgi:hypothetical protein
MKIIINEEQLRQIIESEGGNNLFTIPAHFLKSKLNAIVDNYKKKRDYDGLRVMGNLNLEKLPSDVVQKILNELIEVNGYLYIRRMDIESLGNLTSVGGSLDLYGTPIKDLGKLKSVGGSLKLMDSKIESLGNLGYVGGNLDLSYSNVESLGKLIRVGGNLDLINVNVNSLGDLEYVGGNLYIADCPLSKLSDKKIRSQIEIKGEIYRD